MEFRIADTFQKSLMRLTGQEQTFAKTTVYDLQINPAQPGHQFHRIERAQDPHFWSVRVGSDIRIVVHKTANSLMVCYVDHHDNAYTWAMRRKIEVHPRTGAAQLVEVRERVEEIPVYKHVEVAPKRGAKPPVLARFSEDTLLGYGVPPEWMADVQRADEDELYTLFDHLPQEAAEALYQLALGNTPEMPAPFKDNADPFEHPDAQRRFRVLTNVEELERALEYPWEQWTVFLHPAQRHLVNRSYNGPARVAGSAGTGKTVVALHRAVALAKANPGANVLLATFSNALANALNIKVFRLIGNEPKIRDRIHIYSWQELGDDLYTEAFGPPALAFDELVTTLLMQSASAVVGHRFSEQFLREEWRDVVDAWQLRTWEQYRDVPRLGRKTRLGPKQREVLWSIFEQVHTALAEQNLVTWPMVYDRITHHLSEGNKRPFDFAVVDEAQDLGVPELRLLAVLGKRRSDALFFAGDLGQRIFQTPFSWKHVGVDVRGRSHTLTINYRTSHQIRQQADRLLPKAVTDVDGNVEERRGTVSVFNGPTPTIMVFDDVESETLHVGRWVSERRAEGIQENEIGIFVRSDAELPRAREAVKLAGAECAQLDDKVAPAPGCIAISTMHLAKGLEFRAVAVMACDDEVIPQQSRMETVTDESDLEEVYTTERHLLYVACTRARDHLLVTGVDPVSEFLDDLRS